MALQQPGATVPAKDSVIVARGTNRFRFGEVAHRLPKQWSESVRRTSHAHLRLRSPFMKQPGVVEAFIPLHQPLEEVFYFSRTIRGVSTELVSNRQAQKTERQLVLRLDGQDVPADRLRLFRFIQRAVELNFRDSFRNAGLRDALQLEFHRTSFTSARFLFHSYYFILPLESSAP